MESKSQELLILTALKNVLWTMVYIRIQQTSFAEDQTVNILGFLGDIVICQMTLQDCFCRVKQSHLTLKQMGMAVLPLNLFTVTGSGPVTACNGL